MFTGSNPSITIDRNDIRINLDYEVMELLDYDGNYCKNMENIDYDSCRFDYLYKVSYNK